MHSFRLRYIALGLLIYIQSASTASTESMCSSTTSDFQDIPSLTIQAGFVFEGRAVAMAGPSNAAGQYNVTFRVRRMLKGTFDQVGLAASGKVTRNILDASLVPAPEDISRGGERTTVSGQIQGQVTIRGNRLNYTTAASALKQPRQNVGNSAVGNKHTSEELDTIVVGLFGPEDPANCVGPVEVGSRTNYIVFLQRKIFIHNRKEAVLGRESPPPPHASSSASSSHVSNSHNSVDNSLERYFRVSAKPVHSDKLAVKQVQEFNSSRGSLNNCIIISNQLFFFLWLLRLACRKYWIVTGLGHFSHKNCLLMRSEISSSRQVVSQTGDDSIFVDGPSLNLLQSILWTCTAVIHAKPQTFCKLLQKHGPYILAI